MFMCKASAFVQFTFSQSGNMIILALLAERVIAVTKPFKAAVLLSPKRSLIISIIMPIFLGLCKLPQIGSGHTAAKAPVTIGLGCIPLDFITFTGESPRQVYMRVMFIINGVLPLSGILIMNLIILCAVKSSKKITRQPSKKRNMHKNPTLNTGSQRTPGDQDPQIPNNVPTGGPNTVPPEQLALDTKDVDIKINNNQMATKREKLLTVMTVVMTMAFFVCASPSYVRILVFDIVGWQNPALTETVKAWTAVLAHCLFLLNSAINFYIYVMTGSKLRSDLKMLFHLKCNAK